LNNTRNLAIYESFIHQETDIDKSNEINKSTSKLNKQTCTKLNDQVEIKEIDCTTSFHCTWAYL